MRVFGFSQEWEKLKQDEFTTFRFHRKDRDWEVGETVQVVLKHRTKQRKPLGIAEIVGKEERWLCFITPKEAQRDGFRHWLEMLRWMMRHYPQERLQKEPMVKLTLRWRKNGTNISSQG